MSREDAKNTIYEIINSGIISEEMEEQLNEICERLCADDWDKCEGTVYCEGCKYENN